jgi:hypothetical protein
MADGRSPTDEGGGSREHPAEDPERGDDESLEREDPDVGRGHDMFKVRR